MDIETIVSEIKSKPELRGISDEFVKKLVEEELNKRPYLIDIISKYNDIKKLKRNREFLEFFKEIRSKLHNIYGVFMPSDIKKIWKIINSEEDIVSKVYEVLRMSRPTRERLNYYPEIYENIFDNEPREILDLACGLNPISIYFSKYKPEKYVFSDVSSDIVFINEYMLDELGINNEGYISDIFDMDIPKKKYEIVFIWKTVPIIEKIRKGYTIELIKNLEFEKIVISFPRKSLSGRRRLGRAWIPWIKKIAKQLDLNILKEFEIPNEYFIILSKE